MALAYYFTLALCAERRNLPFRVAVVEHYVFALPLFFMSALVQNRDEHIHVFEGATTLADSVVLLPLPVGLHVLVAGVVFFGLTKFPIRF